MAKNMAVPNARTLKITRTMGIQSILETFIYISYAPYDLFLGKRILPMMQGSYVMAGGGFAAGVVGFGNDRFGAENRMTWVQAGRREFGSEKAAL